MASQPLVQVFEAMMEKRQIPDEKFLMTKKGRKNRASKDLNTETICPDILHIAVKLYMINGDKFRIMSMFFIVTVDKILFYLFGSYLL